MPTGDLGPSWLASTPARIIVVEDEPLLRWSLRAYLERSGFESWDAADAREAIERCPRDVDLVLLECHETRDVELSMLDRIRESSPGASVIMMTDESAPLEARKAQQHGAAVCLSRPFTPEQVLETVKRVLEDRSAAVTTEGPVSAGVRTYGFDRIIGESSEMRQIKSLLRRIAASPATTLLLTGESGTGKDLVSRCVHYNSTRADREFVNITCSALPEALLESELFGHERGAFTDAKAQKRGLFEIADKGTVFLDEIGELTMPLQSKLLRFLEERAFRRVGGSIDIHVDVRVIAATNRDLRAEVQAGRFREDLYYRLSVVPIRIPALRERSEDLPALVRHYLNILNRELGRSVSGVTPAAERLLMAHSWPGNVRELRNVLERAVLLTDARWLDARDFQCLSSPSQEPTEGRFVLPPSGVDLEDVERSLLLQALERTRWNKTRAAKLLGLNRDQIRYRITKFSLSEERGREPPS